MSDEDKNTPLERFPRPRKQFEALEQLKDQHLNVGCQLFSAGEGKLYVTDFVLSGVVKRSRRRTECHAQKSISPRKHQAATGSSGASFEFS
jgi:hypothetical protein